MATIRRQVVTFYWWLCRLRDLQCSDERTAARCGYLMYSLVVLGSSLQLQCISGRIYNRFEACGVPSACYQTSDVPIESFGACVRRH